MVMKRSVKITGLLIISSLLFCAGCKRQAAKQSGASPRPKAVLKQAVEAFGVVKAREYKDINLEFPAQITAVPVQDGERVKRGQALIYLNINDFQSQIKEKKIKLYEARFDLLKQEKVLRDARDAHQKALDNLRDKEKLLREGALSAQEVDDYRDVVLEKERAVTDIKLSLDRTGGIDHLGL
jgi:HlyD family secretion protein